VLAGVSVPQPSQLVDDHLARSPHTRPRFVDVSTGKVSQLGMTWTVRHGNSGCPSLLSIAVPDRMPFRMPAGLRLRFLEWGSGSEVVLLLHDIGEAADIWEPIGRCMGQRGFHTFALDLRGEHLSSSILPHDFRSYHTPPATCFSQAHPQVISHHCYTAINRCQSQATASQAALWMGGMVPTCWQKMSGPSSYPKTSTLHLSH
jgi:hypothetical protein